MDRLRDSNASQHRRVGIAASVPLSDARIYRPGPLLALGILAGPAAVTLVAAAVALDTADRVPLWLPLVLVLWLPCLPFLWLALKSVRVRAVGIAIGVPWRPWHEITWQEIEHVRKRLGVMRVTSAGGTHLAFAPFLLRDGLRLQRQLLLRLPGQVLAGRLRQEAQLVTMGTIYPMPAGGLAGTVHTHVRLRWVALALGVTFGGLASAWLSAARLPHLAGMPLALLALVIAAVGTRALLILCQRLVIAEGGIALTPMPFFAARTVPWEKIELIEITPHEALIRFRTARRLLCSGPRLLRPRERDLMRAFIHEYCISRGVPIIQRRWLR